MPLYKNLSPNQWQQTIDFFNDQMHPCRLCPRQCQAQRSDGKFGVCQAGQTVKIASYNLHFGEEPPISGHRGSGTIFFSGCTLKCVFCQNYPISHLNNGEFYSIEELANIMLYLQKRGSHNINLVSPTPHLFHFISALYLAYQKGLNIPIVYNTSGFEQPHIIKALTSIIDVYLPDFKYADDELSQKLSGVNYYVDNAYQSIDEMFRQTGILKLDDENVAQKGVIIRHLIIPGHIDNSFEVLSKIAESPFNKSYLSLMSQYFPAYHAVNTPPINRRLSKAEYNQIKNHALKLGFHQGWFQDI